MSSSSIPRLNVLTAESQRGLTIIELLIGVAVGLVVVAGAVKLMADTLGGNRRLLLETRVNQDLRAAADLIARDLRRAGYWQNAVGGLFTANPYAAVTVDTSTANANSVEYQFARDNNNTIENAERAGFRVSSGVLEFRNGAGGWQAITDPRVVTITNLTVSPLAPRTEDLYMFCPCLTKLDCTTAQFQAGGVCYQRGLTMTIRQYDLILAGRSTTDATVQRELRETVRVRNDVLAGQCPVKPSSTQCFP